MPGWLCRLLVARKSHSISWHSFSRGMQSSSFEKSVNGDASILNSANINMTYSTTRALLLISNYLKRVVCISKIHNCAVLTKWLLSQRLSNNLSVIIQNRRKTLSNPTNGLNFTYRRSLSSHLSQGGNWFGIASLLLQDFTFCLWFL